LAVWGIVNLFSLISFKPKLCNALPRNSYIYDFPTSGYDIVDATRSEIDDQSDWDVAKNTNLSQLFQYKAAERFGIMTPFSPQEEALSNYLVMKQAGLNISTYAWGLYFEKTFNPIDKLPARAVCA